MQGDVVRILNTSGATVVAYSYDAWGKCTITTGASNAIANANPIRYRGYYYDTDTGFYYLQSRYYDPAVKRFINADDVISGVGGELLGYNQYAYCLNNPVMHSDCSGHMPEWLGWTISGAAIAGGLLLCATGVGGIAGGVLIGAGAGSLINGYVTQANGGDFTAGYIGGAISGALCGVGSGLGGLAFSAAVESVNMACAGYLTLGMVTSFAGGFTGNLAGTVYTNWQSSGFKTLDINYQETLAMSTMMGTLNIFSAIGSGMSTVVGNMVSATTDVNSKGALGIIAGAIAGGTEAFYDTTSYIIGEVISLF